jgi:hypothetical protein
MNWTRAARAVPAAVCGTGLLVALAGPAGAQEDPAGNNGTVKIDRVPFDDHPNNEPHVGCEFQVDFYGFDEGDLSATVTFEAVPPTQSGATDVPPGEGDELLTDEVAIGQDAAGGRHGPRRQRHLRPDGRARWHRAPPAAGLARPPDRACRGVAGCRHEAQGVLGQRLRAHDDHVELHDVDLDDVDLDNEHVDHHDAPG